MAFDPILLKNWKLAIANYLAYMFTGIIECIGEVVTIEKIGTNLRFLINSPILKELKIDQSVSHNGVCLTIESLAENGHWITAIEETLLKTDLISWIEGKQINLERCMLMNGRIDGHIVQGHVDLTAVCIEKKELDGSWEFSFQFPKEYAHLVIEKGSIAINGTSLTCFNVQKDRFTVAIIPYTYDNTNIHQVDLGTAVNIEFDILGKYIQRRMGLME